MLDDGTVITELIAICRYFEALQPEPPLFGRGATEIALVEMWNRRAEINFFANVAAVFRHLHPAMKEYEVPQVPAYAEAMRPKAIWFLELIDKELASREFIAGDHYSVADITTLCAVDFMKPSRIVDAGGADQCETLACRGVGAAEREGLAFLHPPLEGEGRPLERSESGRGGVSFVLVAFTPPRSLRSRPSPSRGG